MAPHPRKHRMSRLPLLSSEPDGVQRANPLGVSPPRHAGEPPVLRDDASSPCRGLKRGVERSAPGASAPAYRRFQVTGDAEPPGLARRIFKRSLTSQNDRNHQRVPITSRAYAREVEATLAESCETSCHHRFKRHLDRNHRGAFPLRHPELCSG